MDLEKFISDSITGIINGVSDAQGRVSKIAIVEPHITAQGKPFSSDSPYNELHKAEFDIAVTVSDKERAGISVLGAFAAGVSAENANNRVSRIKFSVSYVFKY